MLKAARMTRSAGCPHCFPARIDEGDASRALPGPVKIDARDLCIVGMKFDFLTTPAGWSSAETPSIVPTRTTEAAIARSEPALRTASQSYDVPEGGGTGL